MPFKSERQRRFLWANYPEIAKKWAAEEKKLKQQTRKGRGRRKPRSRK